MKWSVLVLLVLSGCLTPPSYTDTASIVDEPVVERGRVLLFAAVPANTEDHFDFRLRVMAPDGQEQEGRYWTNPETQVVCIATCPSHGVPEGDLRPAQQDVSSYSYFLFEDTVYNGTWTIEVEQVASGSLLDPVPNRPDADHCMRLGFSEPDRTFRDGKAWEADPWRAEGAFVFDYAVSEWDLSQARPCGLT